jgi:hypothetical protein
VSLAEAAGIGVILGSTVEQGLGLGGHVDPAKLEALRKAR